MPDSPLLHIGLFGLATFVGAVLGWLARGRQSAAPPSGTREAPRGPGDAWHAEQERLALRNRALVERLNALQASEQEATNRARELSSVLKEAFARRDRLQRQVGAVRAELGDAFAERQRLRSELRRLGDSGREHALALSERDRVIFRLSRELEGWQERLPPLIQRFSDRDEEARRFEAALDAANERIQELEAARHAGQTPVAPVDPGPATAEHDGSSHILVPGSGRFSAFGGDIEPRSSLEATDRFEMAGSGRYDVRDDLQAIKGVGPAIERTLHALGFFSYSQIAEMNEYDINRVAERLRGFRSRIYREDWIGQARELQYRRGRRTH